MFGPHVTNLGDDERRSRPARRLLRRRAARRLRHDRRRGSQRPRVRLAVRAGAARRPGADGWAAIAAACQRPRRARDRLPRPRRRAGLIGVQPARSGAVPGPEVNTREVPKSMEADDIAAVIAGSATAARSGRSIRLRRCRDQRRPAQPGPPVPVRAHQPPRRRMGRRPTAVRPRRDRRRTRGRRADEHRRSSPLRATSWRRGRESRRSWRRPSPRTCHGVDYLVVVRGRSSRRNRPAPTSTNRPASTSTSPRLSPAIDVPVILQGSVVDVGASRVGIGGRRTRAAAWR